MATTLEPRPEIVIREISGVGEIRAVEDLQMDVWGFGERDVIPLEQLIPAVDLGGVLLGAFDGEVLAGFVYGFVGLEDGVVVIHSEMLGVRPGYRDRGLGYLLKVAQRQRALAQGIRRMTWTFDPLQARNAHFNLAKLGAAAPKYKVNYYGEATSSYLHAYGTDRLWARWELDSPRVAARLAGEIPAALPPSACRVLECGASGEPHLAPMNPDAPVLCLEIPAAINGMAREAPELAKLWRQTTRHAFTGAFSAGYAVCEFHTASRAGQGIGIYELRPPAAAQRNF